MLKTVYFTLIQSLIDYGITIWGSANQTNIKSVQRLQSRCARLLTGYFYLGISSLEILSQLGLLNVKQRYSFFVCIMVYKSLNDSMPNHICDTLTFLRDCHNHDTKNELLLKIPLVLLMVNELLLMLGPVYGITCQMFLNHLTISAHLEKICITFYCHDY